MVGKGKDITNIVCACWGFEHAKKRGLSFVWRYPLRAEKCYAGR